MTLADYVKKINGVPFGHSNSLRNNLYRSLGAKNFSTFWNYWNPIFGYYLGKKIFKPLKRIFPIGLALIFTFIFCGLLHDFVTTILRKKISLFFTFWFLIMSLFVLISKKINYNLSDQKWIIRTIINLFIIGFCFFLTRFLNTLLSFY